jgi:uncharacterized protein DUF4390
VISATARSRGKAERVFVASCVRVLVALTLGAAVLHAEGPDLKVTPLQRDGQVFVSFEFSDGLSPDVRDAIQSGLPTTFSYEIELRQGSALFDRTIAQVTISASVRFDNLTRRYQMSRAIDGRVEDARPTEDQEAVREWMTRFDRVPVTPTTALETNGEYYVRVRALARPRSTWLAWFWDRSAALGNAKFTFIP